MTAEQFRRACHRLFGKSWGWQERAAEALGVDRGTVSRYLSGTVPVSGPVSIALKLMLQKPK